MTRLVRILLFALAPVCGGCASGASSQDAAGSLADAFEAIDAGNVGEAVKICNELLCSPDTSTLTWNDYCRVANIYARAYDMDYETESSMASAARCIERARRLNADSVAVFLGTFNDDYSGSLNTVVQTLDGLNTDRLTIGSHEEDDSDISEHIAD